MFRGPSGGGGERKWGVRKCDSGGQSVFPRGGERLGFPAPTPQAQQDLHARAKQHLRPSLGISLSPASPARARIPWARCLNTRNEHLPQGAITVPRG